MSVAQSCSPPGAAADSEQSAGREVRGWEKSQTLRLLGKEKIMSKGLSKYAFFGQVYDICTEYL